MDGRLMTCSFQTMPAERAKIQGLSNSLTYSIVAVRQIRGARSSRPSVTTRAGSCAPLRAASIAELRFVQLRSPLTGPSEWCGRWSPGSRECLEQLTVAQELGMSAGEDDLFWMVWDDFKQQASEVLFSEASFLLEERGARQEPADALRSLAATPRDEEVASMPRLLGTRQGFSQKVPEPESPSREQQPRKMLPPPPEKLPGADSTTSEQATGEVSDGVFQPEASRSPTAAQDWNSFTLPASPIDHRTKPPPPPPPPPSVVGDQALKEQIHLQHDHQSQQPFQLRASTREGVLSTELTTEQVHTSCSSASAVADLQVGDRIYRKGQLGTVVAVDHTLVPPSYVVKILQTGQVVGCERHNLEVPSALERTCSSCFTPLPSDAQFCSRCGTHQAAPAAQASPTLPLQEDWSPEPPWSKEEEWAPEPPWSLTDDAVPPAPPPPPPPPTWRMPCHDKLPEATRDARDARAEELRAQLQKRDEALDEMRELLLEQPRLNDDRARQAIGAASEDELRAQLEVRDKAWNDMNKLLLEQQKSQESTLAASSQTASRAQGANGTAIGRARDATQGTRVDELRAQLEMRGEALDEMRELLLEQPRHRDERARKAMKEASEQELQAQLEMRDKALDDMRKLLFEQQKSQEAVLGAGQATSQAMAKPHQAQPLPRAELVEPIPHARPLPRAEPAEPLRQAQPHREVVSQPLIGQPIPAGRRRGSTNSVSFSALDPATPEALRSRTEMKQGSNGAQSSRRSSLTEEARAARKASDAAEGRRGSDSRKDSCRKRTSLSDLHPDLRAYSQRSSVASSRGASSSRASLATDETSSSGSTASDSDEDDDELPELGELAVELHMVFRPRRAQGNRRRSTITEDNSGGRFIRMLEDAFDEICEVRSFQLQFKKVEWKNAVETEVGKDHGGWNVCLWIYAVKKRMTWKEVAIAVRKHFVDVYDGKDEPAGGAHHDLFQKYRLRVDMVKDRSQPWWKPGDEPLPRNSLRRMSVATEAASEVAPQPAPAPGAAVTGGNGFIQLNISGLQSQAQVQTSQVAELCRFKDSAYMQVGAAVRMHFEVKDKQGLLVNDFVCMMNEFKKTLEAYAGIPGDQVFVHIHRVDRDSASQAVAATLGVQHEVLNIHAVIKPERISMLHLRCLQKKMSFLAGLVTNPQWKPFFDRFEPCSRTYVDTSCFLKNEGTLVSPTLVGSQTYSHVSAHVDIYDPSAPLGTEPIGLEKLSLHRRLSPAVQDLVRQLADRLTLDVSCVHVHSVTTLSEQRRRVYLEVKPASQCPDTEEMRSLQRRLANQDTLGVRHFIEKSLVINSTIRQTHSYDPGIYGANAEPLCCHLDVFDENDVLHRNGREWCGTVFTDILKELAKAYGATRELQVTFTRFWRNGASDKDYTLDFKVKVDSPSELRLVQELLWSLHQDETREWAKKEPRKCPFFDLKVQSVARICAAKMCFDNCNGANFAPGGQLQLPVAMTERPTMWAEIDVTDRFGNFKANGATHFAVLLGDFLHLLASLVAARVSILDVRAVSTGASDPSQPPQYKLKLEIDFSGEMPKEREVCHIYEMVSNLHGSEAQRQWWDLPLLQQYVINASACVHLPEAVDKRYTNLKPFSKLAKVVAHMDILSKDQGQPFHQDQGWSTRMASMVVDFVAQACEIDKGTVVVSGIQLRHAHDQRFEAALKTREKAHDREVRKKTDSYDSENENVQDSEKNETWASTAAAYTVDFEVYPKSIPDRVHVAKYIRTLAQRLRKLHSCGVIRKHGNLEFFKSFEFDMGIQMVHSSGCHLGHNDDQRHQPLERHVLSREHPGRAGPVLFAGTNILAAERRDMNMLTADDSSHKFLVFSGYVPIIERRRQSFATTPEFTNNRITQWFLQAMWSQIEKYRPDSTDDQIQVSHLGAVQADALSKAFETQGDRFEDVAYLLLRPRDWAPTAKPLMWDGLVLRVLGVRSRAAHTEKVEKNVLPIAEGEGIDCVRMIEKIRSFSIDFEVQRISDSQDERDSRRLADFARNVRKAMHWCVRDLLETPSMKSGGGLYQYFEYDRGVQIDRLSHEEVNLTQLSDDDITRPCTDYSLRPRTLKVRARFISRKESSNVEFLKRDFKKHACIILGVDFSQLSIEHCEVPEDGNCELQFNIRTLSHAPASAETECLLAKLRSMHYHCTHGRRWWCSAFGDWVPVSVTFPPLEEGRGGSHDAIQFTLRLLNVQKAAHHFSERELEALKKDLAGALGVDTRRHRRVELVDTPTHGEVEAEICVSGLRKSRDREAFRQFLVERGKADSIPLALPNSPGLVSCSIRNVHAVSSQDAARKPSQQHVFKQQLKNYERQSLDELLQTYVDAPLEDEYEQKPIRYHVLKHIDKQFGDDKDATVSQSLLLAFGTALLHVLQSRQKRVDDIQQSNGGNLLDHFMSIRKAQDKRIEFRDEIKLALRILVRVLKCRKEPVLRIPRINIVTECVNWLAEGFIQNWKGFRHHLDSYYLPFRLLAHAFEAMLCICAEADPTDMNVVLGCFQGARVLKAIADEKDCLAVELQFLQPILDSACELTAKASVALPEGHSRWTGIQWLQAAMEALVHFCGCCQDVSRPCKKILDLSVEHLLGGFCFRKDRWYRLSSLEKLEELAKLDQQQLKDMRA
eukprot:TRINITY_DN24899_c0_g1_i1.p1 TRINITY_DN24899_c0_g1~~TRINITY_DN24899_c0_g1_i1.p1  ORF type:complete len:2830 (+),score=576.04 TRINITY_DN24899_c0_g1_i1:629-8491(+)